MYDNLTILAVFIFLYSITSGGLERTPINGALIFAAFGLTLGPMVATLAARVKRSGGKRKIF